MAGKKSNAGVIGQDENFDWGAPEEFDGAIGSPIGGGIELPWFVPYLSWLNGSVPYKQSPVKGAYTGAWSAWVEAMQTWEGEYGSIPSNFQLAQGLAGGKQGEYDAYLAQWLPVTVIGERTRWLKNERGNVRSHTQVLAYCAFVEEQTKELLPFAPVVLTVKGWQSDYLKKAIKGFEVQTLKARREIASKLNKPKPLHQSLFWMMIGTSGKERQAVPVGTGKDQSDITPIQLIVPKEGYTSEAMKHLYIGKEVAQLLIQLKQEAGEWLNDAKWKAGQDQAAAVEGAGPDEPQIPPPADGDEFPF